MKVSLSINDKVSFGRNLTESEAKEYSQVLKEAKAITGQTGKSIFIMPTTCLPQSESYNSGIGSISSKYAQDYFDYMRTYLGFNVVEDLPAGQVDKGMNGLFCAYNGSAFALGNSQINPELLATKEFENLLTSEDLKDITNGNLGESREEFANFRNVMAHDGMQNKVLKRAYERFKNLPEDNQLRQRFITYKKENDYWLWMQEANEPDSEYYKFKQFLADEHLKIGKQKLNEKGIKLFGDFLVNFNKDEVRKNPKAFKEGHYMGLPEWGLQSLNYDEILDESSEAAQLLKKKVQLFSRRYDGIRFDVGWGYVSPLVTPEGVDKVLPENKKYLGDGLLKLIEKWVKEFKGEDFDLKNLIYEFDGDPEVFSAFNNDGTQIEPLKGRVKIYGSTYMHEYDWDKWGYNEAFINKGMSPDEFILGIGNHDPQPLRQIALGMPDKIKGEADQFHKPDAIQPLSRILKISKEVLENPVEFAKAKWAETMQSKNTQMFYMDVFGREERFDMQGFNTEVHPEKNYAYKVPSDYRTAYMQSIKEGFGFNPMDALEKLFVAKGFDKEHPKLFSQIVRFKNILLEDEPKAAVKEEPHKEQIPQNTPAETVTQNSKHSKFKGLKKAGLWLGGLAILGYTGYKLYSRYNKEVKS